uniref:Uncharacterized protein n=1 Tax=Tanacetum cinerariifolium TaxID=118510 RepID=A0A6L2JML3_TANCI|nr:hypothetical protein [Tanacetum cinerariifolium]
MSGTVPPIPPPLGTSTGSLSSLNANRVDMMPNADPTNTTTTNVARNVVEENNDNLPQLLDRPSDTRDTKIAAFNAFKALEVNATFVNNLPRKWLSMNQTQRANNSIKNDSLTALYGKYHYKEVLIDDIYASETQRFTIQSSSSKALISNIYSQDSDSDVEEDNRTINEFLAGLNAEYHERALWLIRRDCTKGIFPKVIFVAREEFVLLLVRHPLRGVRDEEVVVGEDVVVTSSSLDMLTNSCLGGIMVCLIFLEGLEEVA